MKSISSAMLLGSFRSASGTATAYCESYDDHKINSVIPVLDALDSGYKRSFWDTLRVHHDTDEFLLSSADFSLYHFQ